MGQKEAILDKIKRNLDILGIAATRNLDDVTLDSTSRVISYEDTDLKAPMGGVDDQVSPFLGIGTGNPGQIKMKGAGGENTIVAILDDEETLRAWGILGNMANDKILEAGDSAAELARVEGHPDLQGMGQ